MNWKFYVRADGMGLGSGIAFGVRNSQSLYSDYIRIDGGEYYGLGHGSISNSRFINGYLKEIQIKDAFNRLAGTVAINKVCKLLGIDVNLIYEEFQGPPNPFRITVIKKILESKKAFCADSAYQASFSHDDSITVRYLLSKRELFHPKKDDTKFYLPLIEENV